MRRWLTSLWSSVLLIQLPASLVGTMRLLVLLNAEAVFFIVSLQQALLSYTGTIRGGVLVTTWFNNFFRCILVGVVGLFCLSIFLPSLLPCWFSIFHFQSETTLSTESKKQTLRVKKVDTVQSFITAMSAEPRLCCFDSLEKEKSLLFRMEECLVLFLVAEGSSKVSVWFRPNKTSFLFPLWKKKIYIRRLKDFFLFWSLLSGKQI